MFPQEYINFGKIVYSPDQVRVHSDHCHVTNLLLPCGSVKNAYWQGNNIHVEMEDGWHFMYESFNDYSHKWRQ